MHINNWNGIRKNQTSRWKRLLRSNPIFGPWPRALEACGILPDRSVEREAAKLQKRIAAKRRQTQYKLERQGRLKEQTDDKKQ